MRSLVLLVAMLLVLTPVRADDDYHRELKRFTFDGPEVVQEISDLFVFWGAFDRITPNIAGTPDVKRHHATRLVIQTIGERLDDKIDVLGFDLGTGECKKLLAKSRAARGKTRDAIALCFAQHGPVPWEDAAVAYSATKSTGRMIIDLARSSLELNAYLDVRARLESKYKLWRITSITVRRDRDQVEKEFARMTKLDPPAP